MDQGPARFGGAGEAGPNQPEPVADSHRPAERPTPVPQSVPGLLSAAECKCFCFLVSHLSILWLGQWPFMIQIVLSLECFEVLSKRKRVVEMILMFSNGCSRWAIKLCFSWKSDLWGLCLHYEIFVPDCAIRGKNEILTLSGQWYLKIQRQQEPTGSSHNYVYTFESKSWDWTTNYSKQKI